MKHLDRPLSPKERQALWAYLGGVAAPAGGLGPEALDGFFTALVIGPETVMPSVYLPVVLGRSEFSSDESAHRIFGFLMFIRDGIRVLHGHWLVDRKREAGTMRVEATRI